MKNNPLLQSHPQRQLGHLLDHCGETVSRDYLVTQVWGDSATTDARNVDVHMACLRQKLEENPKYPGHLQTVRSFGYRLSNDPA